MSRRTLPGLLVFLAFCATIIGTAAQSAPELALVQEIELPGTRGRIDHLAIDLAHRLLFIAALGGDAVDVVDLNAGRRASKLDGRHGPQGVLYLPALQRLLVANGQGDSVEALHEGHRQGVIAGLPDADNLRLDPQSGLVYVGYGNALAELDPRSMKIVRRLSLPGHPEAFQLAKAGGRIYVNVPSASAVIVLDRESGRTIATWSVTPHGGNFPMALDDTGHRVFVGTRKPPALLAFDSESGALVAQAPLCGDADDLFFDGLRRVVYGICGDGRVAIVPQTDASHFGRARRLSTADGARTGLFSPELKTLFVAAPARAGRPARLLVYRTE
jgi:DNA-binding beta-propeller fold protein YncE